MPHTESGYANNDTPGAGIDTITFGNNLENGDQYLTSGPVTQSADSIEFNSAAPWGEGDGLNGDVIRPEDAGSLLDVIERVEFDATIFSASSLRKSELNASIRAFNEDGNHLFERTTYAQADFVQSGGVNEENGDEIVISADTTDIFYREDLNDSKWQQRELLRNISNSSTPDDSGSTFLFIRPESIRNQGIISIPGNSVMASNPEPNDFQTLSQTAPLSIELSNELISEISYYTDERQINLDNSQIAAVSTDFGSSPNITIKLSDYQDSDGNLDYEALNSDRKFTLELSSNAAENITWLDEVYANVGFNSQSTTPEGIPHQYHLRLHETDHDSNNRFEGPNAQDSREIVENAGPSTTIIELGFDEYSFNLSQFPENAAPFITYNISDLSTSFNTLGGHTSANLTSNELNLLQNSIQSITLDLTDWNFDSQNSEDVEISIIPLHDTLDLS